MSRKVGTGTLSFYTVNDGVDGENRYTWIKYADTPTTGMSDSPVGKDYLGIAYNKLTPTPSTNYSDYTWSLVKGQDGTNGVPGPPGEDGQPTFTWIKYADDANGTNMSENPTGKAYMGIAINKPVQEESSDPLDYEWVKVLGDPGPQGLPGADGADGITTYTWVRYADDEQGSGMSNFPDGKMYIGIAYNKTNPLESEDPEEYTWSLFRGSDGIDGEDGEDGTTYYTWIKYADTPTSGMSDNPEGKAYMGIAYNKLTPTESTSYADYSWSLIKGEDGIDGVDGEDGADAMLIRLTASNQVFKRATSGTTTTPATITVEGSAQGTTISTWTYSVDGATFSATVPAGVSRTGNKVTITGASMTANTIAIKAANGSISDTVTIVRVQDGSNAVVAFLSNESHTLPASDTGVVSSFTGASTTMFIYQGVTDDSANWTVTASASSGVTGTLSGKTYTVTALSTDVGTVSLTATRAGYTSITKVFTISKSKGGRGIASSVNEYYLSTSRTTQTGGSWSTTAPKWQTGRYLWIRLKTTFSNGAVEYSTPYIDTTWEAIENISIGGRNLATLSNMSVVGGDLARSEYLWTITKDTTGSYTGIKISPSPNLDLDTEYVLTFKVQKESGSIPDIGGHLAIAEPSSVVVYIDGVQQSGAWSSGIAFPDDTAVHSYTIKFKTVGSLPSDPAIYIQPGRLSGYATTWVAKFWDIQLEKGNTATAWKAAPEDTLVYIGVPPDNPQLNQLWLDTSTEPSSLNYWDGTRWVSTRYNPKGEVTVSGVEPDLVDRYHDMLWLDTSINILKRWDSITSTWVNSERSIDSIALEVREHQSFANIFSKTAELDSQLAGVLTDVGAITQKVEQIEGETILGYASGIGGINLIRNSIGWANGWHVYDDKGPKGVSYTGGGYAWIKFADTATGVGMTDLPDGKTYIGIAYGRDDINESEDPSVYTWTTFRSTAGVWNPTNSTYTWIKFADAPTIPGQAPSTGISNTPEGKPFFGFASNKTTSTKSNVYSNYTWYDMSTIEVRKKKRIDFWDYYLTAPMNTYTNKSTYDSLLSNEVEGYGSAWTANSFGSAAQLITGLRTDKEHTLSAAFKIPTAGSGIGANIFLFTESGVIVAHLSRSEATNGFLTLSTTFTPTEPTLYIVISINSNVPQQCEVTSIMLNEGSTYMGWSKHSEEIYSTNIFFNINGIKVQSGANFTQMTPTDFSGYVLEGANQDPRKVFSLNGDTTQVANLKAEDSIEMGKVRIENNENGWVFMPQV